MESGEDAPSTKLLLVSSNFLQWNLHSSDSAQLVRSVL